MLLGWELVSLEISIIHPKINGIFFFPTTGLLTQDKKAGQIDFSSQLDFFPHLPQTTLTFVDSISEIFGPLLRGKRFLIFPKKLTQNVEQFVTALDRTGVTRLFAVTSLVKAILAYVKMRRRQRQQQRNIEGTNDRHQTLLEKVGKSPQTANDPSLML